MATKCDICEATAETYYISINGDVICSKTCFAAQRLENYLLGIDRRRKEGKLDPNINQKAWSDAGEMAAWLSVYRHGNKEMSKKYGKAILKWWGNKTDGRGEEHEYITKSKKRTAALVDENQLTLY